MPAWIGALLGATAYVFVLASYGFPFDEIYVSAALAGGVLGFLFSKGAKYVKRGISLHLRGRCR